MSLLLCSRVCRTMSRRVEEERRNVEEANLSLSLLRLTSDLDFSSEQLKMTVVRSATRRITAGSAFYGFSLLPRQITTCSSPCSVKLYTSMATNGTRWCVAVYEFKLCGLRLVSTFVFCLKLTELSRLSRRLGLLLPLSSMVNAPCCRSGANR